MTNDVSIRFYAELNDFLPAAHRQKPLDAPVAARATVKHLIEALGVPHTEVDLILVHGTPVGFSQLVQSGDRISVFPRFHRLDVPSWVRMIEVPSSAPRFVLDAHLGKLTTYLRILGLDVDYANNYDDATLARIASTDRRILLTRDRALLMRRNVAQGMYVRHEDPEQQTIEVIRHFDLLRWIAPFTRCLHCNNLLIPIDKAAISHRLLPKTRRYYHEFRICPECDQIFWRGSHWEHMQQFIARLSAREVGNEG